jgi:hypothetical protein
MRSIIPIQALVAGLILIGVASEASAAIVTYTYTGTVGYGYDLSGVFGSNTILTGEAFKLVEKFDTSKAAYKYVDSSLSLQFGGSSNSAPGSASLIVTIGTGTRSISDVSDFVFSASSSGNHQDFVKNDSGFEYSGFYIASPLIPADYAQAFSLNSSNAMFTGNYQYSTPTQNAYASFDVSALTVTNSTMSPVPLPGSLPMFAAALLGLGGIGYAVGRKRAASEV